MAGIDFLSPTYRAAGTDLVLSISPLGLVELADEEFEVHGPRLNRYALNWALYLGHHWSYRREAGENLATANYFRAMTNYLASFTFGKGVKFDCPEASAGILPDILRRVWEYDNNRISTLMEMGIQGAVSGDCFVLIAYEEPYVDPMGVVVAGKCRIIPLNAAHVFPEYHPHDRSRLIRAKIKYRFWGTDTTGTRQVFTYTQIMSDTDIEEYLNDELIDSRPNPIGKVPVVHIPNIPVPGSPWGLADCHDIISVNRQYNEISTSVGDIIAYHAEPVTIITGAKASQLERGAKKIWAGLPKDAKVENLEGGYQGLKSGLEYMEILKRTMHELTGIPETALGQAQPISNTSGVALSIQFQPLMNRWQAKTSQYGYGIQKINELIVRTIAVKEPNMLVWQEGINSPLEADHLPQLDPADPLTYYTEVEFPPPLPLDKLVVLNELATKFSLGLESREGALRLLGEEFPDEKLAEIREELKEDAFNDGALAMVKASIQATVARMTGMIPGPDGNPIPAPPPEPIDMTGDGMPDAVIGPTMPPATPEAQALDMEMQNRLNTLAYGTKLARSTVIKPDA